MKIEIENFRKIESANCEIQDGKINLIAGHGHQGKTSFLKAITSAYTRNPLPFYRADGKRLLDKKESLNLVSDGKRESFIKMGGIEVSYPACSITSKDASLEEITEFSAGLIHFTDLTDKEKSALLGSVLGTEPTKDALENELVKINLPKLAIDKIHQSIEAVGWDSTFDDVQKKCTQMKGQWREVAGEQWGSAKASTWQPEEFSPEMEGMSEVTLTEEVQQAREGLEAMISQEGANENEINALELKASTLKSDLEKLPEAKKSVENAEIEVDNANNLLAQWPDTGVRESHPCPHCKGAIEVNRVNGKVELQKFEALQGDELEYAKAKNQEAKNTLSQAQNKLSNAKSELSKLSTRIEIAKESAEKLHEIDAKSQGNNAQEIAVEIDKCRKNLAESEKRLEAFKAKNRADQIHKNIALNLEMQNILKPEGLRKTALESALGRFNEYLTKISNNTYDIKLKPDLSVQMNSRPFALLSGSEQFLTRAYFQIAIAHGQKCKTLIFDGADILDSTDRQNFVGSLAQLKDNTSIVSMTILKKEDCPRLAKFGIGVTFWVDNGKIEELNE